MKTLIKYPQPVMDDLRRIYPYRNEMKSLLLENGYKVPDKFDQLLVAFGSVFGGELSNPDLDTSFLNDLWETAKKPFNAVIDIGKSIGLNTGNLIGAVGGGLGARLGGGGNYINPQPQPQPAPQPAPQPSIDKGINSNTLLIIAAVAAVALYFIFKK